MKKLEPLSGEDLKSLRELLGLSRAEIADIIGTTRNTIYNIELGNSDNVVTRNLLTILYNSEIHKRAFNEKVTNAVKDAKRKIKLWEETGGRRNSELD